MELAVIFDMDGVLIDSVGLNWKAYNQILAQYDVHVSTDDIHKYMGKTLEDQVKDLDRDFKLNINVQEFDKETREIKKDLFARIEPLDGVKNLLELLKANGIPLAVGTSNDRQTTTDRLKIAGLIDYFTSMVTQDDVMAHKPNPEIYLECAKKLNVSPSQCVVIEDAPVGIQAAHNAKIKCIAVKTPYASTGQLEQADLVVDSLNILNLTTIEKLLNK